MENQVKFPLSAQDSVRYSIFSVKFEPTESGEFTMTDKNCIAHSETSNLGQVIRDACFNYGIKSNVANGYWESPVPKKNKEEQQAYTIYDLQIWHEDGRDLSNEETKFLTCILNNENYTDQNGNSTTFQKDNRLNSWTNKKFGVGGFIFGTILGFWLGMRNAAKPITKRFKEGGKTEEMSLFDRINSALDYAADFYNQYFYHSHRNGKGLAVNVKIDRFDADREMMILSMDLSDEVKSWVNSTADEQWEADQFYWWLEDVREQVKEDLTADFSWLNKSDIKFIGSSGGYLSFSDGKDLLHKIEDLKRLRDQYYSPEGELTDVSQVVFEDSDDYQEILSLIDELNSETDKYQEVVSAINRMKEGLNDAWKQELEFRLSEKSQEFETRTILAPIPSKELSDKLKSGKQFKHPVLIESFFADTIEDSYEEGEIGSNMNHFGQTVEKVVNSGKELLEAIGSTIIFTDVDAEMFDIDDSLLMTSILVDEDNFPAGKSEIESWEKGEKRLWNATYNITVKYMETAGKKDEFKEGGQTLTSSENRNYIAVTRKGTIQAFSREEFIMKMQEAGFELVKIVKEEDPEANSKNPIYNWKWLVGTPKFKNMLGAMNDNGTMRYESQEVYDSYSYEGGGNVGGKDSMLHFVTNEMSSGFVAANSMANDYNETGAIKTKMREILTEQGDRKYTLKGAVDLVQEAESELHGNAFKTGGQIKNQYEGKLMNDVWNSWTEKQRIHFLQDHQKETGIDSRDKMVMLSKMNFDDAHSNINLKGLFKASLFLHVSEGQYKEGGKIYITKHDHMNPDYKEAIAMFNEQLSRNKAVKKLSDHYERSVEDVVKHLQTRISVYRKADKSIKEVRIDYTDSNTGINVHEVIKFGKDHTTYTQTKVDHINQTYAGVTASSTGNDRRIRVESKFFNTINEIKRNEFDGSAIVEKQGDTYVLTSNKAYFKEGGNVWTPDQEKAYAELNDRFQKHLEEKGIDPYSYEASQEWKTAGFREEMRTIFGNKYDFKEGGEAKSSLNSVYVMFDNPDYNYVTSMASGVDKKAAEDYFVGKTFNVGTVSDNMQKVKSILWNDEIDEYFYKKGLPKTFNWNNFTLNELYSGIKGKDISMSIIDDDEQHGINSKEFKKYADKSLYTTSYGEVQLIKGRENLYLTFKAYQNKRGDDDFDQTIRLMSKDNHTALKNIANQMIAKMQRGGDVEDEKAYIQRRVNNLKHLLSLEGDQEARIFLKHQIAKLEKEQEKFKTGGMAKGENKNKMYRVSFDFEGSQYRHTSIPMKYEDAMEFKKIMDENEKAYDVVMRETDDLYKRGGVAETQQEKLTKELLKLQRDLNSSRLRTYKEGDTSEQEMARRRERESKLTRFNEVLGLLRQIEAKEATFKTGGMADSIEYSEVYEILKDKIEDTIDDLPNTYENRGEFTGEEVEHKSYDGFVPFTNGGFEATWFEYLRNIYGSGYSLPTAKLDKMKDDQIENLQRMAADDFKRQNDWIEDELGDEELTPYWLEENGYEDEAEELRDLEDSIMDDETIMMQILGYYYKPSNDRGVDGKHTISLQAVVNMESPYHRRGKFEDFKEVIFTFDSIEELEQKLDENLAVLKAWFEKEYYNSDEDKTVRKYKSGGEVEAKKDEHELAGKIRNILSETLPNFHTYVRQGKHFYGGQYLAIVMAASDYEINNVRGQYPQDVSLMLDLGTLELRPQVFGGNGGQAIYLIPDKENPKEKYLAMARVNIPFRKPKKEEKFVLDAIKRFAENYKKALIENRDRLFYQNYVDYDKLLSGKKFSRGGGVDAEEWMENAISDLNELEDADFSIERVETDFGVEYMEVESDGVEYIVFENYDNAEEYAVGRVKQDLEENPEYFNKDFFMNHIHAERARNWFSQAYEEMDRGYAEDIKDESDDNYVNRLVAEMVDAGIMDEDEATADDAAEVAEDRIYEFVQYLVDDKLSEGGNGYDYYESNFGEEEARKVVIDNGLIDEDEAAREAVRIDGVGHFLAHYDGNEVELPSGAYAYRTN
jgi:hypothetical protein